MIFYIFPIIAKHATEKKQKEKQDKQGEIMITNATETIIKTALAADQQATPEEKKQILASLTPKHEKMLTTREVCDILGITRRTLFAYVKAGKLSAVQYSPRKLRYSQTEVMEFSKIGVMA